ELPRFSADPEMIRRRPNQQHHCSLCAGLSAPRERVWWSRTASLMASLLSPASARGPPRGLGGGGAMLKGGGCDLVSSIARPGGNMTGINFLGAELAAKRLGLLSWCPGLLALPYSSIRTRHGVPSRYCETWKLLLALTPSSRHQLSRACEIRTVKRCRK